MTEYKIPLRKNNEIIEYALVDKEDFEEVNKLTWRLSASKGKTQQKYATGYYQEKKILMHHFLIGKPEGTEVVDHISRDGLDNRRSNLRKTSMEANSQNANSKYDKTKTSSKYLGVSKLNDIVWTAIYGQVFYRRFPSEEEAVKAYDTCVLLTLGKHAKTNGFVTFAEVEGKNLLDLYPKNTRDLPKNIHFDKKTGFYTARIVYKGFEYRSSSAEDIQNSIAALEVFKKQIAELKDNSKKEYSTKDIVRDEERNAVIYSKNKKGEIIAKAIVDDNLWHDLSQMAWSLHTGGSIYTNISGVTHRMHIYILRKYCNKEAGEGQVIGHKNGIVTDNRVSNLYIATMNEVNHNATKPSSSEYIGVGKKVTIKIDPFCTSCKKDDVKLQICMLSSELEAAIAYNIFANHLYGEHANLNNFNGMNIEDSENKIKTLIKKKYKFIDC